MALKILKVSGEILDVKIKKEVTPGMIFDILKTTFVPIYNGKFWIFLDFKLFFEKIKLETSLNENAVKLLDFPVYGDCVVCDVYDLCPEFFVNESNVQTIQESNETLRNTVDSYNKIILRYNSDLEFTTYEFVWEDFSCDYKKIFNFCEYSMARLTDVNGNDMIRDFIVYIDDKLNEYTITNLEDRLIFLNEFYNWTSDNNFNSEILENITIITNHFREILYGEEE